MAAHALRCPLTNDLVLDMIFKHLTFEDLKNCRMVNKTFNGSANRVLEKIANCVIKNPDCICRGNTWMSITSEEINMLPKKFILRTSENCLCLWNVDKLIELLNNVSNYIINLTIEAVNIPGPTSLNLSSMGNITTLKLESNIIFTIPIENLSKIRELYLNSFCTIKTNESNVKVCIVKLKLLNVEFYPTKEKVILNDYFNFSETKHLVLRFNNRNMSSCEIEFANNLHFDVLEIYGVVIKPNSVKGEINSVKAYWMDSTEFVDFSEARITNLECVVRVERLNLLPKNVEHLKIWLVTPSDTSFSELSQMCLPHLKKLNIDCVNPNAFISFFVKYCKSLETVQFSWHSVNINTIPSSIKKLMFRDDGQIICDVIKNIDTLVLDMYSLENARNILTTVKPKNLILRTSSSLDSADEVDLQVDILTFGPIIIGSLLKYYSKENNICSEISEMQFTEILKKF